MNGPFGKRSLHRNRAVLLSCFLFLILYNLITRDDINTDLEMLPSGVIDFEFLYLLVILDSLILWRFSRLSGYLFKEQRNEKYYTFISCLKPVVFCLF